MSRKRGTLRIYGDSFAELIPHHGGHRGPRGSVWLAQKTWHEWVINSGIWRRVLIHAAGASSLWQQYCVWKKTHEPGDDVLWFETDTARLTTPDDHRFTGITSTERVLASKNRRNRPDLGPLEEDVIRVYEAARDYYYYLYRPDYTEWVHSRMIDNIERDSPRVRFLACFDVSQTHNTRPYARGHMSLATVKEWNTFVKHESRTLTAIDARRNHMTYCNHQHLAQMICEHYTTGEPIDMNTFLTPDPSHWDKYFYEA